VHPSRQDVAGVPLRPRGDDDDPPLRELADLVGFGESLRDE
jgi:hypothetical protein